MPVITSPCSSSRHRRLSANRALCPPLPNVTQPRRVSIGNATCQHSSSLGGPGSPRSRRVSPRTRRVSPVNCEAGDSALTACPHLITVTDAADYARQHRHPDSRALVASVTPHIATVDTRHTGHLRPLPVSPLRCPRARGSALLAAYAADCVRAALLSGLIHAPHSAAVDVRLTYQLRCQPSTARITSAEAPACMSLRRGSRQTAAPSQSPHDHAAPQFASPYRAHPASRRVSQLPST